MDEPIGIEWSTDQPLQDPRATSRRRSNEELANPVSVVVGMKRANDTLIAIARARAFAPHTTLR